MTYQEVKTTQIDEFVFVLECLMSFEKSKKGIDNTTKKVNLSDVPIDERTYTEDDIFFT